MKTTIALILFIFCTGNGYTQKRFEQFPELLNGTPSAYFAAKRQVIKNNQIRTCQVFRFTGDNQSDSVLQKTLIFDNFGNLIETRQQDIKEKLLYDEENRVKEVAYWSHDTDCFYKVQFQYETDTVRMLMIHNYHNGDSVWSGDPLKVQVKKGMDTIDGIKVYNDAKQVIKFMIFDRHSNSIQQSEYIFTKEGYPKMSLHYKDKKSQKQNYLYTHELINGEDIITMWNGDIKAMKTAVQLCTYKNDKCVQCKSVYYNTLSEYFYTEDGVIAEELVSVNGQIINLYKYRYSK